MHADVRPDGVLLPARSPSPAAPTSGYVHVFAKADDRLWQRDSAGVEKRLAVDPTDSWTSFKLAADETVNLLGAADLPGLSFAPLANTLYEIEALLPTATSLLNVGAQYMLAGPTSGVTMQAVRIETPSGINASHVYNGVLNALSGATLGLTVPALAQIKAQIKTGPTPAGGNFRVRLAASLNLTGVTAKAGAILRYRVL